MRVASGWVRLTGLVDDPYERREAEAAVAKLDGVVGISNLIEVAKRDSGETIAFARPAGA